jgi:hypothetical protein
MLLLKAAVSRRAAEHEQLAHRADLNEARDADLLAVSEGDCLYRTQSAWDLSDEVAERP